MVDIYSFEIHSAEFDRILSGKKTVQLMVNEPKRKDYAVGNQITFKRNMETISEDDEKLLKKGKLVVEIQATVSNLLYFNDFIEAINTLGKESCGFKPSVAIEKTSDLFLAEGSYEQVEKYGIVALVFEAAQK
jgi:ASC-1-like (ASCH) protein